MYTGASAELIELLNSDGRTFIADIKQDGVSKGAVIRSIRYTGGSNSDNYITMGTAYCASVELTLYKPDFLMLGIEFQIDIGMMVDDSPEYVPLGFFTAEKPSFDGEDVKVTLYDRMRKFEKPYFPSFQSSVNASAVAADICQKCGVPFLNNVTHDVSIPSVPSGYTCREMIVYLAQLLGCFAIINRDGKLEFTWYTTTPNYTLGTGRYWDPFDRSENNCIVHRIAAVVGKETDESGHTIDKTYSAGTGTKGIVFENPFYTQAIVDDVYNRRKNFTFRPGKLTALGDPRLEPGDLISVSAMDGNTYAIPVMTLGFDFDGGLTMTISAVGEEEMKDDFSVKGPTTQAIERLSSQLILAERLIANKIDADVVEANYATIISLNAAQADIDALEAREAQFETATVTHLNAIDGDFTRLNASLFDANTGHITVLESDYADIIHLLAGNEHATSVDAIHINADNAVFDSTFLKDLIAANISVQDLKAGIIYTNRQRIMSEDGTLDINGSTIQIHDENETLRVQIGKDGNDDYNLYLWNAAGDLIWNASGITADGVPTGIIVNSMVSDHANISGSKLDIHSVVGAVNEVGGLSASSVVFDEDGQSLEVHFANLLMMGKNIIVGTLHPDVSSLPRVRAQGTATTVSSGILSVAEHGFRVTNSTPPARPYISFPDIRIDAGSFILDQSRLGSELDLIDDLKSLQSGKDYVFSFDAKWKLLSADTTTDEGNVLIYVEDESHTLIDSFVFGEIAPAQKGTHQNGTCAFKFTIPAGTTKVSFWIGCDVLADSMYSAGDYIEISNVMLESGVICSSWEAAPEDLDRAISAVDTKVNIANGLINTLISRTDNLGSRVASVRMTVDGLTQEYSRMSDTVSDFAIYKQTVDESLIRLSHAEMSIDGAIARITTAEQKITPEAIVTTVKNSSDMASYIVQTADAIRMKAEKLVWTANNSSMTEDGKLTVNSADIGGIHVTGSAIYSGSHSAYNSSNQGFYLGSDGKVGIGNSSKYLRWDGSSITWNGGNSSMDSSGKLTINSADVGGVHVNSSAIYSGSHSSYNSTNQGFYLGNDGKVGIGNSSKYLRWDGSNLTWNGGNTSMDSNGKLTISSADIGGIHVTSSSIYSGSHSTYDSSNQGFYLGSDGKIGIGDSTSYLRWDTSGLAIRASEFSWDSDNSSMNIYGRLWTSDITFEENLQAVGERIWVRAMDGCFTGMLEGNECGRLELAKYLKGETKKHIYLKATDYLHISAGSTVYVHGAFDCIGTKSRLVTTEDYGSRHLYSYETPTPMFGDVGEGMISSDGKCYVPLDPTFAETISDTQYQIFLQTYGEGEAHVSYRCGTHFVVSGTPGLAFGWELKAKQAGYEDRRLDAESDYVDISDDKGTDAYNHYTEIMRERRGEAA